MNVGGCLCGAVRYELHGESTAITYCHCSMCRRWHGHVGAYAAIDHEHLVLVEQRGLKWYASSANVRRGFCVECGSSLFFEEAGDPKIGFSAGSVDEPTQLRSKAHIFVASKGDYYAMSDDGLVRFDTMP